MPHPTYSRISSTGHIRFYSLDSVKHVWRFTMAEIDAHEDYTGPMALKIVAHVMIKGCHRHDTDQYTLYVKATPKQWAQFVEGRDAHIAAVRAHHAAAAPAPAAEEDPQ
jgi:hypothetical protein